VNKTETNGEKPSEIEPSEFKDENLDKILGFMDEIMACISMLRDEMEEREKADYEKSSIHMGETRNG